MTSPANDLLKYIRDNDPELFDELEWSMSLEQAFTEIAEHYGLEPPKKDDPIYDAASRLLREIIEREDDLK